MKKILLAVLTFSIISIAVALSPANAFYRYTPRPAPTATPTVTNGDAALIAATKQAFGSKYKNSLSVAFVDTRDNTTRFANLNSANNTQYEVASITKSVVGHLLADSITRGEVTADQKIGTLLPIPADKPLYHVTLQELAIQNSGLPAFSVTSDAQTALRQSNFYGTDPTKSFNKETLISHAIASYNPANRGKYTYSNLAYAVLGHGLAAAAQKSSYKQLQEDRFFAPLGMTNSIFPEIAANLPAGYLQGKNSRGRTVDPWTLNGYAPTGGIRSDINDMATFAKRLLQNNAVGMDALNPRYTANNGTFTFGQAYAWEVHTDDIVAGRTVVLKTGNSGGFASIIMLDRTRGTAVIALANTSGAIYNEAGKLMSTDGK